MKTYMAKASDQAEGSAARKWYILDATDQPLGRMAARLAKVLQGKHKPEYTPHIDMGDFVVVINAEKVKLTGKKALTKTYPYYTGWTGGLKERTYADLIERDPARVIQYAVRRMLPKSKLGRKMLGKLKVHKGSEHPHTAQQPESLDLAKI